MPQLYAGRRHLFIRARGRDSGFTARDSRLSVHGAGFSAQQSALSIALSIGAQQSALKISVQHAAFSMQRSACSVQHAAFSMQRSACSAQQSALKISVQHAALSIQRSAYRGRVSRVGVGDWGQADPQSMRPPYSLIANPYNNATGSRSIARRRSCLPEGRRKCSAR
jgi:hypothetical protein